MKGKARKRHKSDIEKVKQKVENVYFRLVRPKFCYRRLESESGMLARRQELDKVAFKLRRKNLIPYGHCCGLVSDQGHQHGVPSLRPAAS